MDIYKPTNTLTQRLVFNRKGHYFIVATQNDLPKKLILQKNYYYKLWMYLTFTVLSLTPVILPAEDSLL